MSSYLSSHYYVCQNTPFYSCLLSNFFFIESVFVAKINWLLNIRIWIWVTFFIKYILSPDLFRPTGNSCGRLYLSWSWRPRGISQQACLPSEGRVFIHQGIHIRLSLPREERHQHAEASFPHQAGTGGLQHGALHTGKVQVRVTFTDHDIIGITVQLPWCQIHNICAKNNYCQFYVSVIPNISKYIPVRWTLPAYRFHDMC